MYPELDKPVFKKIRYGLIGGLVTLMLVFCMGATVNTDLTATRGRICIEKNNISTLKVEWTNKTGQLIRVKETYIPVSGNVTDEDGNVVNATVPGAYTTARTSFLSQVDSLFDSAATAGKVLP